MLMDIKLSLGLTTIGGNTAMGSITHVADHTFSGEQEHVFSGATLNQYDCVIVELIELTLSTARQVFLQVSTDDGSSWIADYNDFANGLGGTVMSFHDTATEATLSALSSNMRIWHMGDSARRTTFEYMSRGSTSSHVAGGQTGAAQAENALRVRCSTSTDLSGGTVRVWGIKF